LIITPEDRPWHHPRQVMEQFRIRPACRDLRPCCQAGPRRTLIQAVPPPAKEVLPVTTPAANAAPGQSPSPGGGLRVGYPAEPPSLSAARSTACPLGGTKDRASVTPADLERDDHKAMAEARLRLLSLARSPAAWSLPGYVG
jgi:hypothetical protein